MKQLKIRWDDNEGEKTLPEARFKVFAQVDRPSKLLPRASEPFREILY
jgi:hypothetical protein